MRSWRGIALLDFLNPLLLFADKLEETISVANGEHIKDATNYILTVLEYKWNIDRWIFKIISPSFRLTRSLSFATESAGEIFAWIELIRRWGIDLGKARDSSDPLFNGLWKYYDKNIVERMLVETFLIFIDKNLPKIYFPNFYTLAMILFFPPRINFTA